MASFRSYGNLDDVTVEDGDSGFVGVDLREREDRLRSGELTVSLNGRISGSWESRKGVESIVGLPLTGTQPLRLPFLIYDMPGGQVVSAASRLNGIVTLTVNIVAPVFGPRGAWVGVSGAASGSDLNGMKFVTVTSSGAIQTLSYASAGADGAITDPLKLQSRIDDGAVDKVLASCVYSDPNTQFGDFIFIATNKSVFKINLQDSSLDSELTYPILGRPIGEIDMIQAFDSVYLFDEGKVGLASDGSSNFSSVPTGAYTLPHAPSVGQGFIHQPCFGWAVYFQRRLVGAYRYDVTGTNSFPVITDREVRDEIVISDILDPNTYDRIENQFRVTAGIADEVVAAHPFSDDVLLVFNRNSIHAVIGTQGSLADTITKELTREIGCAARKSVATKADKILFLSDDGVYGLTFLDGYQLRGVEEPLSKPIEPIFKRLNKRLLSGAVSAYWNNRYWLALPLDSEPDSDDAAGNNAILVYNFLNSAWESVDFYDDDRFLILNLHVARSEKANNLYAVSVTGGIHQIDSLDLSCDLLSLEANAAPTKSHVSSAMTTRAFDMGSPERKRFYKMEAEIEALGEPADAIIDFETANPDEQALSVAKISSPEHNGAPLGADNSIHLRTRTGGQRGQRGKITIRSSSETEGRIKVGMVGLCGTITNRKTTTQK